MWKCKNSTCVKACITAKRIGIMRTLPLILWLTNQPNIYTSKGLNYKVFSIGLVHWSEICPAPVQGHLMYVKESRTYAEQISLRLYFSICCEGCVPFKNTLYLTTLMYVNSHTITHDSRSYYHSCVMISIHTWVFSWECYHNVGS